MQTAFVPQLLIPAFPEIFLAIAAMLFLMFGVFSKKDTSDSISILCVISLGLAAVLVAMTPEGATTAFDGAFILDPFARLLKILSYTASAAAIVMSMTFNRRLKIAKFEFPILI
jgi:NADH-quinone oxidoreductase subunit N